MPTYFNISVQFKRYDLYPLFVKDFHAMLDEVGMVFQSGYWGFEDDSLEEIIRWNQRKLEEDFNLGFTEHHMHDYKQVVYSFSSYSEVRGFWMNNYPDDGEFTHEIIIPESDVLAEEYLVQFKIERIEELIELAKRIWQFPLIKAMQTGLEGNDASVSLAKLAGGRYPNIWPFAIIEETEACYNDSEYDIRPMTEGKRGFLFLRKLEKDK